jgi:hypothetical protein
MDPRTSILTRWRIAFCRAYHDDYGALLTRMDKEICQHKAASIASTKAARYFLEKGQAALKAERAAKKRADENLLWAVFFFGLLVIEAFRVAMGALQ